PRCWKVFNIGWHQPIGDHWGGGCDRSECREPVRLAEGCCWSGSEKAQAFCSGRFVERARAFRLRRVVPVAPYAARPFQVPSDGRFGPAAVLLCDVVEQFEMFVCGLLEKVSRRLATREALQPHAVPERLDQLGKVLIAKRGDQLNVEFEIGIKEGNQ